MAAVIRVTKLVGVALSLFALCAGCVHNAPPRGEAAITIDELIERNAQALGGRERLDALNSVRIQRKKNVITLSQRPLLHIVYLRNDDGSLFYAEGFNGEVAWEQYNSPTRYVVEGRPKVALWQTLQFPKTFNPLYKVREAGHSVTLIGREKIGDIDYYTVEVTLTNGASAIYEVNPQTWLIERTSGKRRHHAYEDNEKRIETVWSDFRNVDGYTFPFIETERDLDTGEILSGGLPFYRITPNFIVDESVFGLDGGYDALLLPDDLPSPRS